jgi:hypothetical protein
MLGNSIEFIRRLNKKFLIVGATGFFLCAAAFIIGRLSVDPFGSLIGTELGRYDSGEWIVNIDGDTIGSKYLDERFDVYTRINPLEKNAPLARDILLKKLVDNYLILSAVKRSGIYRNKEFRKTVWHYTEEAMVDYYLDASRRAMRSAPVNISQKAKDDFYESHKKVFDAKGKNREEAMKIIEEQMIQLNALLLERNEILDRRIELGWLKKGKKIKFNTKYLGNKEMITP